MSALLSHRYVPCLSACRHTMKRQLRGGNYAIRCDFSQFGFWKTEQNWTHHQSAKSLPFQAVSNSLNQTREKADVALDTACVRQLSSHPKLKREENEGLCCWHSWWKQKLHIIDRFKSLKLKYATSFAVARKVQNLENVPTIVLWYYLWLCWISSQSTFLNSRVRHR